MAYIKSHSNYVLKKKHQNLTNGGSVFERDITTIGGLNQFAPGQKPIYRSGNFIITVNKDLSLTKEYGSSDWVKNGDAENWTSENITPITSSTEDTNQIVLKQDCYSLRDFAYYGSCSELIRSSMTDIINKFPGELYSPSIEGKGVKIFTKHQGEDVPLTPFENEEYFLFDNPFNINLHDKHVEETITMQNPLRYFANEGCNHFEILKNNTNCDVFSFDVYQRNVCIKGGKHIASITIKDVNGSIITLEVVQNNIGELYYLTTSQYLDIHIRPKKEHLQAFYKDLDMFQRIILNPYSTPKYSALFEVIEPTSQGYSSRLQRFTFPISYGGYNLAVNNQIYASYVDSLSTVAAFYDEMYSDNFYRSMTHEAIKNFDWTYSREYTSGEEEENIIGGTRLQKALRLLGRAFDEVKLHADAIGHCNQITYDDKNNLPNYFLSDALDIEGWDVKNIYPFIQEGNLYPENTTLKIKPYKTSQKPYFISEGYKRTDASTKYSAYTYNSEWSKTPVVHSRIKQFSTENEYSMNDVNNHFMKMLKLNSKHLWRHKGTIDGIEMILSMFGLKSDRFVERKENSRWGAAIDDGQDHIVDYKITEYVVTTNGIDISKPLTSLSDNKLTINDINKRKLVPYDTDDYRNGIYHDYQGLLVRKNGDKLYPYYSHDMIIDGNPYYQMNGGWLHKLYHFNEKDEIVLKDSTTSTLRDIGSVNTIKDLMKVPYNQLSDNQVFEVKDRNTLCVIIDGEVYDLQQEVHNGTTRYFFKVFINNGATRVGRTAYRDKITVSSLSGKTTYNLREFENGTPIKIYVSEDNKTIVAVQDGANINNIVFCENGNIVEKLGETLEGKTKYFQILKKRKKNTFGGEGWKQVSQEDEVYKKLSITKNYFKGNNPHNTHLRDDMGNEYFRYLDQIFKYALDNKLFDKRCWKNETEYWEDLAKLRDVGFDDVWSDSQGICEDIEKSESTKIEYFEDGDIPDSIINTKRVVLEFGEHLYHEKNKDITKYIDQVVLHYLTQMLPSNVILEVIYRGYEKPAPIPPSPPQPEPEPITSITKYYTFTVEPSRVGANGGDVSLNATLYTQTTVTHPNGESETVTEDIDITTEVNWECNGSSFTPSNNMYKIGVNDSTSEKDFKFTTQFDGVELSGSNVVTVIQDGAEEKEPVIETEEYYTFDVQPREVESNGGSVILSATLVTITTVTPHNGTPTTSETKSSITKDVVWYCNGIEYGTNKESYNISENTTQQDKEFTFNAIYSNVSCKTNPITVKQKKMEEVWGDVEITLSNSYGPDITFQQRGSISIVKMVQKSNLNNIRTMSNYDFDIEHNGKWGVHNGLKIDSIDDNNRTCVVSLNRDYYIVEQEEQVSIYFYYNQDGVTHYGVCTLMAHVDLNGDNVIA